MATLNNNDIIQITYVVQQSEQVGLNVRHYRYLRADLPALSEATVGLTVSTDIEPFYRNLITTSTFYRGLLIRRLEPSPTPTTRVGVALAAGLVMDELLPRQVAGMITLYTDTPGVVGRGRAYVPFPFVGAQQAGQDSPTAAYVTLLTQLGAFFGTQRAYATAGAENFQLQPVLRSKPTGAPAYINRDIVGYSARTYWGTQRRRGELGSPNFDPTQI